MLNTDQVAQLEDTGRLVIFDTDNQANFGELVQSLDKSSIDLKDIEFAAYPKGILLKDKTANINNGKHYPLN